MSDPRKLTDTVWQFLDRARALYGRMMVDRWGQEMHNQCLETGPESPIEDLFLIASHLLCEAQYVTVNPEPERTKSGEVSFGPGVFIDSQAKILKYRVDFAIKQEKIAPAEAYPTVVVELDGHDFHDRDQRQRSYEKRRDRELQRAGCLVLHYTGSDVVRDPFAPAFEALQAAGAFVGCGFEKYDPQDPLGLGA